MLTLGPVSRALPGFTQAGAKAKQDQQPWVWVASAVHPQKQGQPPALWGGGGQGPWFLESSWPFLQGEG